MNDHDETLRFRRSLEGILGVPATEGNRVRILRNGDEIFPAMFNAITAATHTIDFLTFVYWEGAVGTRLAQALTERARAGVRVRVLLDAMGSSTMDPELISAMTEAGCDVEWFRPVDKVRFWQNNHRTHRKVLVCDEKVAFTGGVGIADEWTGNAEGPDDWRDTHFRVEGPAVDGLRAAFVQNWAETGRDLFDLDVDRFPEQAQAGTSVVQVVRGCADADWSDVSTLLRTMVHLARRRLRIATAYFVPANGMEKALVDAVGRGVKVEILVPGPHADKRLVQMATERYYGDLMAAGVGIWTYQPSMMHAKVLTVDGAAAAVGSANFNSRSMLLDDEVNLAIFDPEVVATLDSHFDDDLAVSKPLEPGVWDERSRTRRVGETVMGAIDQHF